MKTNQETAGKVYTFHNDTTFVEFKDRMRKQGYVIDTHETSSTNQTRTVRNKVSCKYNNGSPMVSSISVETAHTATFRKATPDELSLVTKKFIQDKNGGDSFRQKYISEQTKLNNEVVSTSEYETKGTKFYEVTIRVKT